MASPVREALTRVEAQFPGAVVAERGRAHIKHRVASRRYVYQSQVGRAGWHFGPGPYTEANEIDTAWVAGDGAPYRLRMQRADYHAFAGLDDGLSFDAGQIVKYVDPGSGESISFQPQALEWTNDLDQIAQIGAVQAVGAQLVGDDKLLWSGAFGPGLDFRWTTQTVRLQKLLMIQSAGALGSPPQFILDGGNPVLRLQFIFQRSAGVRAWVDGVLFDEGNKHQLTTANNIEFRSTATGAVLWTFNAPQAWDSFEKPQHTKPLMRIRATAQNLFIEVRVPWSWLQLATYPVFVDPTTNPQVGSSSDDAYEQAGSCSPTIAQVAIDQSGEYGGWRWPLTAANGSTSNTCYVSFYFFSSGGDEPDVAVRLEDSGASPSTFTTDANDISNRTLTTDITYWSNTDLGAPGWFNSPSMVDTMDELFGSYDYSSGGYVVAVVYQVGAANRDFVVYTYDEDSSYGGYFYLDYTEPAGGIALDTAALSATGQALTVVPGAVSKLMDTASLLAGGQAISLAPGAVAIALDTAQLQLASSDLAILPGAVAISLDVAALVAAGQAITIQVAGGAISVPLATAALAAGGQALTVVPGAVQILLDVAALVAAGQAITIDAGLAGVSIALDTATLLATGQAISLAPGAVALALDTAALAAGGQALTVLAAIIGQLISGNVVVNLSPTLDLIVNLTPAEDVRANPSPGAEVKTA